MHALRNFVAHSKHTEKLNNMKVCVCVCASSRFIKSYERKYIYLSYSSFSIKTIFDHESKLMLFFYCAIAQCSKSIK